MLEVILAYTHFLSIITLVSTVVTEAFLCRPGLTLPWVQRLGRVDLLYLITAVLALSSGLLRMFFGAKGAAFYYNNPLFWVKIGLFIIVGLISIVPTMRFIRWAKRLQVGERNNKIGDQEVTNTAAIIYLELGLLALIPLMGSLMARGFGYGW